MLKEQLVLSTDPVGVVVHIGAGYGHALDDYLAAGFEKIYLIEPNSDVLPELNSRAAAHDNVTVMPIAIAHESGRQALHLLNFADLSSLRQPQSLTDLLPGIQLTGERQVEGLTLDSFLGQVTNLSEQKANWLVIEAPGEEQTIATALATSDYGKFFQNIMVQCGQEAYFEGGSSAANVLPTLRNAGYQLAESYLDMDPDWPHYFLRLDKLRLENTHLTAEVLKANNQIADLVEQLRITQTEAQEAQAGLQQQLDERDQAVQNAQGELEENHQALRAARAQTQTVTTDLQAQLKAAQSQHTQALTEAQVAQAGLQQQLADRDQAVQNAQGELGENRQALRAAHAQTQTVTTDLQAQLEAAQSQHTQALTEAQAGLQEQLAATQVENTAAALAKKQGYEDRYQDMEETLKRDLGVALRLQALARSDQQELQMRYAALQDAKSQQDDLLIKVTQQLGSAAQHLQHLAHQESLQSDISQVKPVPKRKPIRRVSAKTAKKSSPK